MADQLKLWGGESPGDRLRWSISRNRRLDDCARKYYLFHYASRGAHQPDASREVRELHVLKSLQNRHMWVGTVTHEVIELALAAWRREEEVPVEALVERGTRIMRAGYAQSMQRIYRERPMRVLGLVEHEYEEAVSREEWRAQRDLMEACVRNFFSLPMVEGIRATPRWRWLALETLGSFEHEGATVVVRPDFAWRDEEERVVLVDWKTGQPRHESENLQLAVYGLFARRTWGLRGESFRGQIVYLREPAVREVVITLDDLAVAERAISDSLAQMRSLADGPAADFELTSDLDQCTRCPFRRVCGRP